MFLLDQANCTIWILTYNQNSMLVLLIKQNQMFITFITEL
jgi:hypothetical protein